MFGAARFDVRQGAEGEEMSETAPDRLYVYQPYGIQNRLQWQSGRIYGIGGLPEGSTADGFTKEEAQAVLAALVAAGCPVDDGKRLL